MEASTSLAVPKVPSQHPINNYRLASGEQQQQLNGGPAYQECQSKVTCSLAKVKASEQAGKVASPKKGTTYLTLPLPTSIDCTRISLRGGSALFPLPTSRRKTSALCNSAMGHCNKAFLLTSPPLLQSFFPMDTPLHPCLTTTTSGIMTIQIDKPM
jgi:hypothetical protein